MIQWYKLHFTTPVHVGERGVESVNKFIPSTTIWSALLNSMLQLGIIDPKTDPKNLFRVNTPSPIINGEAMFWVYGLDIVLYDKAVSLLHSPKLSDPLRAFDRVNNILKNTVLASTNLLKHDLSKCSLDVEEYGGEASTELKLQCNGEVYYFNEFDGVGYVITSKEESKKIHKKILEIDKRPKNVIDRITGSATPYHLPATIYHTPLLLGVEVLNENLSIRDVEASMNLLSDLGIGGERTYGFGKFKYERVKLEIHDSIDGNYIVVQGLYYPGINALQKILSKNTLYNIRIHGYRSGFTGLIRRPVFVLTEGSIIPINCYNDGIVIVDQRYGDRIVRSFDPITYKIKI
ncbi:protein of unknown function DUF324 [Staphylothermus marinus F1]|uniref:CRISPR system Cms protein Csm4 n=1 Tax=Staphylothermus marinus (strain ATCC 43588 / DSM 3639 / JCM 9404 / F1) TaxID=399550 RepID=A3DLB2_STAMF|nr:RAMP superfamily CRISPR-associated protein [Staphylothermus marinus]ABN69422.1 protein of unknown function DUF324 [Staphylothermus marinus F1]